MVCFSCPSLKAFCFHQLSPAFLALLATVKGKQSAWRRTVKNVKVVEFLRQILPGKESADVLIVEETRVEVTAIYFPHLFVDFHTAQIVAAGELVPHGAATAASERTEDFKTIRHDTLCGEAVRQPPLEREKMLRAIYI